MLNVNVTEQISSLDKVRHQLRRSVRRDEASVLDMLIDQHGLSIDQRKAASTAASAMVDEIRSDAKPGIMEVFLTEYGLSTDEGVALMCLAEALLRVPDNRTIDELIEDKIVASNWQEHVGQSNSALVNSATRGLLFTSKLLGDSTADSIMTSLHNAVKRVGEPLIRVAIKLAMQEMGNQFVLGESIEAALKKGQQASQKRYTYSFDMLGEAAISQSDANDYYQSYANAIKALGGHASHSSIQDNPGISIKLSALHPRYEYAQRERVLQELVPLVFKLALLAKQYGIGLNIDAEEAERLDLSLDVIQGVFEQKELAGWDGFGVVVQAYNKSAAWVIDWLYELAQLHDRRIMVRLVKGAYWDSEIKRAQVEGLPYFPVFTHKSATDVAYLCCANKLLRMADRIYPQFATHNAHTIAAIMQLASEHSSYEFQRLHGMGEAVYHNLLAQTKLRCRIYAPVGEHKELLAYLVRRLLENGANSSFVNQIVDLDMPIDEVVADPFNLIQESAAYPVATGADLYQPERDNSQGWDLSDELDYVEFESARQAYKDVKWSATPLLAAPYSSEQRLAIINPANSSDHVGDVVEATKQDVEIAMTVAQPWDTTANADERSDILRRAAHLFEQNAAEIFAILAREAGKTPNDVVAELREAVDFCRYYATQCANQCLTHVAADQESKSRGIFVCISPWNFPLAIFTGQICAALAAGNAVLAKPAESTPLIAFFATKLFHQAGVPRQALQLLPGQGDPVGAALVSAPGVAGVCFTGSTNTALNINRAMAKNLRPNAPLIAETGGINAMIVDSTALPEQAVQDIIKSAFQSAGQRCSALRVLYVQDDIYDSFTKLLFGAIDELNAGDPWSLSSDLGPLINKTALAHIQSYIDAASQAGRVLKQQGLGKHSGDMSAHGNFLVPTVIEVSGLQDIQAEIFGPVLHLAKFSASELERVVADINASNYGLTFGLHTRIDSRAEQLANSLNVGNIYVNRDQIGAIVGSQPFGGENLSGTGPKAGGPNYVARFFAPTVKSQHRVKAAADSQEVGRLIGDQPVAGPSQIQQAIDSIAHTRTILSEASMPGPTGESNTLYEYARGVVLCLGNTVELAREQYEVARSQGCNALIVCPGACGNNAIDGLLPRELLSTLAGIHLVVLSSDEQDLVAVRQAMAMRSGAILPLVCDDGLKQACVLERHVCINTTAAGGNASLLAQAM